MEGEATMSTDMAIVTHQLSKSYRDKAAVNNLELNVPRGSIYGFVGRNGAGKTTTIKLLLNLVHPTAGQGTVLGYDMVQQTMEVRSRVGYVSEEPTIYPYLRVREVVEFCRDTYERWDMNLTNKYLELFELAPNKRVRELSKGMKNQLALVVALGARPELLILDEPTSGLDPVKTRDFLNAILEQVADTGQTVFFSSHQLHEVERIADTVGIIHQGHMVFQKGLDEVKSQLKRVRVVFPGEHLVEDFAAWPGVSQVERQGRGYILHCIEGWADIQARLTALQPTDLEVLDVSLEELFMEYTGGDQNGR